jgi:hypothetical protein
MFTNTKLETSCKNEHEPAKIAILFITPSILNKNEILENCMFWEVQTSGFGLCIIYPNYLSCFKVVPEPGQRN